MLVGSVMRAALFSGGKGRVGTFGVGSAGHRWGRVGAALLRIVHYLTPRQLAIWLMLYADDGWATAQGPQLLMFHLFVLTVLGTPLKWSKVRGGFELEWVGYLLDFGRLEIGISALRAQWCVTWLTDKVRERRVSLGELKEGLGRLVFAVGPLEHLRPLLGPFFVWASAGPRFACPRLPTMLLLLMEFMAGPF